MNEENSLWMGDISPNMEESQIISSFRQYNFYPTHIKFIKDKKTNTNRNYCFVFFKSSEETLRALDQLSGKKILNTNISFKLNKASYHSPINRTVYVGNLNKSITDEILLAFFKAKYDSVIKATVLKEKNLSKGYGFVVFKKENEYKKCLIEMNGEVLQGKKIIVNEQKRKEDDDNSNISNNNSANNNNYINNYNNNIIINNDYNINANNNNIDYLNNFVNNNINKDLFRNKNNINDMNVLSNLNIINNSAFQHNDLKNNINNINNIINNNNIININNNVINQNNNILGNFDIDHNNIINNNLFKRFNNNNSIFEYYRNSSNDNNIKNIGTAKLFMNDNKINNNNMFLTFNKTFNNNNYDIRNNSVNFFNNSYNKSFSNNNNNQNIINNINKPNKKVNIINNGNSINKSNINKNVKKKKNVTKLEILEKIDEETLIKKIRDSINNTFNQFRKISSNGNNIKSKYIYYNLFVFLCLVSNMFIYYCTDFFENKSVEN